MLLVSVLLSGHLQTGSPWLSLNLLPDHVHVFSVAAGKLARWFKCCQAWVTWWPAKAPTASQCFSVRLLSLSCLCLQGHGPAWVPFPQTMGQLSLPAPQPLPSRPWACSHPLPRCSCRLARLPTPCSAFLHALHIGVLCPMSVSLAWLFPLSCILS